jgi:hypothetical protein
MFPTFRRFKTGCGLLLLAGVLTTTPGCSSNSPTSPTDRTGISRERAIEIARPQVTFSPTSVEATKETYQGRPTWAVTFRASDGSHGGLGKFMMVWVDQRTGEIVSLAMS